MNKKYNSINDSVRQQMINNSNAIELLTKMDQALNSTESFITAETMDSSGNVVKSQITTIGYFKQQLDQMMKMLKVLSGVDGNPVALQIANNQFKRIVVADLNLEPKPIPAITPITTFKADPNWIFDAFLNPKISVELDLTGKINDDTRTIQTKRFIVEFDRIVTLDENGNETVTLTAAGAARKVEFEERYKGKSNINMLEFITWLDTPGLINRVDDNLIDQDYFRVEPNRLQYKGMFTITGTDIDTLNKKLWYIMDTLTYYDISDPYNPPKPIDLKIGDLVNVNPNLKDVKSTTVYKVVEISTITSEYRVRFEQVYGEEPIPVRLNALSIYSDKVKNRKVKVSVGFDDYSVLFIRQIDDINNLVGLDWSPGVGFWTNDLRLDNANGELFSEYYVNKVYDYGLVLEDLVAKKIPNYYGIKPNAPVLDESNFKVVQINEYLTQTVEAEQIRDLHNTKNNLQSEIQQIQNAIEKQNRIIQTTVFDSAADRKRSEDDLTQLQNKLSATSQTMFSTVQNILANTKNLNKISPVYHLRGIFPFPEAVVSSKTVPQEVVQFEIWYRKLSKSGSENQILTIPDLNNAAARVSATNTAITLNTANLTSKSKTVNGSFSNWQKFKTDSRKRTQNLVTGDWYWDIEDVSDASTPNINQLDIPILPGEMIEIKIKSLSEVGWPETPVESDFSNLITIPFPDDLKNVLNEDEFILKEAQADDIKVKFERDMEARGLNQHLNSFVRSEDIYYAHRADAIASGFKDSNDKVINLYDQLMLMVNRINSLEEQINKAKGVLEVYLVNGGNKTRLFSGNNMTYNINLEDYMVKTKIGLIGSEVDSTTRTYKNDIIQINDFSILVKNAATTAPLGLLSYRGYGQPSGMTPSNFAYDGKSVNTLLNRAIQPTWILSDATVLRNEIPTNTGPITAAPRSATQQNNQWLWLQVKDLNGNYIYDADGAQPANDYWSDSVLTNGSSAVHKTLIDPSYNIGFLTGTTNGFTTAVNSITKVTNALNWEINENPTSPVSPVGKMGTTIHPVITGFNDITDISTQLTKYISPGDTNAVLIPLYIYAKPYTGTGVYTPIVGPTQLNTKFSDIDYTTGIGDFPPYTGNIKKGTGNKLIIMIDNSTNVIKVNDKIIVTGITTTGATGANNIPLTVIGISSTEITTSFNASAMASAVGVAVLDLGVTLVQIHKRYNTPSGDGKELTAYNVLGRVGGDLRYVSNYIEIVPTSASPTPTVHTKKLRFYMEDESSPRPFEFQLNWNITQYKAVQTISR